MKTKLSLAAAIILAMTTFTNAMEKAAIENAEEITIETDI